MKTYLRFFLIIAIALSILLCSCSLDTLRGDKEAESNDAHNIADLIVCDHFKLERIDNEYRMIINKKILENVPNNSQLADLEFDSLDDLIRSITDDKFESWQLNVINSFSSDNNGIIIFDIYNAPKAKLPNGFNINSIYWRGENYSFSITGQKDELVYIHWMSKDSYLLKQKELIDSFLQNDNVNLLSEEKVNENLTEYEIETSTARLIKKCYRIDSTTQILETYRIASVHPNIFISKDIPSEIVMLKEENGLYYMVDFFNPLNKYEHEIINQFGLQCNS